jgi:hypothetical protein
VEEADVDAGEGEESVEGPRSCEGGVERGG